MRKILLAVLCCALFQVANAQLDLKFGVKGGVSSSSIKMDNVNLTDASGNKFLLKQGDAKLGFHFGGLARLEILSFFVQPELLFSSTGGNVTVKDVQANTEVIKSQTFNRLDIPIIAGWKFGVLRLGVGPVANVILSSKSELLSQSGFEENYKKATWGFQAGLGLDIWKFGADLRYEGNLSKLGKDVSIAGKSYTTDSRNSQWIFSLSYYF